MTQTQKAPKDKARHKPPTERAQEERLWATCNPSRGLLKLPSTCWRSHTPCCRYIKDVGGMDDCDIDLWVLYEHPQTREEWRCLPSYRRTYRQRPMGAQRQRTVTVPGSTISASSREAESP